MKRNTTQLFEKVIFIGAPIVSLLVYTHNVIDPVNAPKLLALGVVAFSGLFAYAAIIGKWFIKSTSSFELTIIAFLLFSLIVLINSSTSFEISLFGTFQRNTGFITYLLFGILAFLAGRAISSDFHKNLLLGFSVMGILNLLYSLIQMTGNEFLPWGTNSYRIIGTFGNPNFISSALGLFCGLLLVGLFSRNLPHAFTYRAIFLALIVLGLIEISISKSIQGFFVFLIITGYLFFVLLLKSRFKRIYLFLYTFFGATVSTAIAFAMFQIGPLTDIVYKQSLTYRSEYWRAGIQMGLEHPLFGVGWDAYGEWYRRARSLDALKSPGADVTSNSAHNVFIDIFASGGFILLLLYLALNVIIIFTILRSLKVMKSFDPVFTGLSGLWIGYTAQSLISINQIGLGVWGWVLGGAILSHYRMETTSLKNLENKSDAVSPKVQKNAGSNVLKNGLENPIAFIGGLIGLSLTIFPVYSDFTWRSSLNTSNQEKIEQAVKQWPSNASRYINCAQILFDNNLIPAGLQIARDATSRFPNDFYVWNFLYLIPYSSLEEKQLAMKEMERLDPSNMDLGNK